MSLELESRGSWSLHRSTNPVRLGGGAIELDLALTSYGSRGLTGRTSRALRLGATLLWVASVLLGCASDGDSRQADDEIPDAVPRVEPRAKYGNPSSYVVFGKRYYTKPSSNGHVERGLASWYGKKFHGRKTSSGEPYDMYAMTAAHKSLPLPSYVRVTNLENGRAAVVRVNDRGPFHGPRVIDLSYSAAKKLGVVAKGTAMVEVRAIDPSRGLSRPKTDSGPFDVAAQEQPVAPARRISAAPARTAQTNKSTRERAVNAAMAATDATAVTRSSQGFYLQVGAFGNLGNAERLRQRLITQLSDEVQVHPSGAKGPMLYKVKVGPFRSDGEARKVSAQLASLGVSEPTRVWN